MKDKEKNLLDKIRHNHWLMMLICCALPLILLIILVYIFGLNNKYLFWFVLLLCPITHYFMMKDMHGKHGDKNREGSEERNESENKEEGENKKCH